MRFTAKSLVGLLLTMALVACGRSPASPPAAPDAVALPGPRQVDGVLYLVGDAGVARTEESPLLTRLRYDIEYWAERLDADSAVAVLLLGDIVYPVGLHPPDHPRFDADTAVVMAQVRLVLGPAAQTRGARIYFMAGNHDWGSRKHWEGFVRLKNLDEFLGLVRLGTGAAVELVPEAGTGGPFVADFGRHIRLVMLDTAWWLLSGDAREQRAVLSAVEEAFEDAGDREIMIAAHHPFRSVGPHGGFFPFWETAGVRYILSKSGAILQDLSSLPYRGLQSGLRGIFQRHGAPLAYAGGHEHSLQVIQSLASTEPEFSLVSGSASKLTEVSYERGILYAAAAPGYMRMVIEKSGGISLFVEAAPAEYLKCGGDQSAREQCMVEGVAAFKTVYSQRLR